MINCLSRHSRTLAALAQSQPNFGNASASQKYGDPEQNTFNSGSYLQHWIIKRKTGIPSPRLEAANTAKFDER
jgi:hypothetical protein